MFACAFVCTHNRKALHGDTICVSLIVRIPPQTMMNTPQECLRRGHLNAPQKLKKVWFLFCWYFLFSSTM